MKRTTPAILTLALFGATLFYLTSPYQAQAALRGAPTTTSLLDEQEIAHMKFIREEEKMARDVYLVMSGQWGLRIFAQIAEAEQTHMDAVKKLLDKYGIEDPALPGVGEFADPVIAELYRSLIDRGMTSDFEALGAGAFIEEFDINDLRTAISETDNDDVAQVYGNLEDGSENHLRAFVKLIEATGVDYVAQYLDQEDVEAILAATSDSGKRR